MGEERLETRARYLLVGVFLFAVILAGFGFVYWLNNSAGFGARTTYRVTFTGPAYGLIEGSSVLFNGIKVGEVTALQLSAASPGEVIAVIAVDSDTPVTTSTKVGLETLGLMGTPSISLIGGTPGAPPLARTDGQDAVLVAAPDAGLDTMRAARQVLTRLDQVVAENAVPLRETIANIRGFAEALGRNSAKVDTIAEGLSGMFGGQEKAAGTSFEIGPAGTFAALPAAPAVQLAVTEPTSVLALDTQKIMARTGEKTNAVFPDSQWSDNLPKLVQSRIVQSFENAGFMGAEEGEDAFDADAKLLIDIRSFYVTPDAKGIELEFSAKLVVDGKIAGAQTFHETRTADTENAAAVVAAFDDAFRKAASELVVWTFGLL